jgi:hypothetical protein
MAGGERKLAEDLVLRHVSGEEDIKGFAAFLGTINLVEGRTAECLLRHHPLVRPEEFLVVQDTTTGEIVSSSCIIPWRMSLEGVELSCAQLETILTHPRYRKRGLVRAQFTRLHELVKESAADIVIIWGIPFYYRQFGYGYCLDGGVMQSLPAWRVEDGPDLAQKGIVMRAAVEGDVPALAELYRGAVAGQDTHLTRSAEHWRYLIRASRFPIHVLAAAAGGRPLGYSIHLRHKRMVHVLESSIPDQDTALALLRELKKDADELQVNWPRTQTLVRLAEGLGSMTVKSTQWLIRIPDVRGFLLKIRPVLDRRLAVSPFAGCSRRFVLNLFREGLAISISRGKVDSVEPAGFVDASMGADGGNLNIPPDAFLRLALGQASLEELYDAWPDIVCRPEDRTLVAALFPKRAAYLYTPYHYYGPEIWGMEEKHLRFYI